MSQIRILTIGDVVGPAALDTLSKVLFPLRNEYKADFVIVNGENAAPGNGIDIPSAKTLLFSGAACPGSGYTIRDCMGWRVLVINVMGTVYMEALESPFAVVDRILERERGRYDIAVLDIHAEATSEKIALGHYFDGRVNIVFGTHTHVPTADLRILPGGSGYITDLGMVGPEESVLGVKTEIIIEKMTTKMPVRFEIADGPLVLCGACFTYDTEQKRITEVKQIQRRYPN